MRGMRRKPHASEGRRRLRLRATALQRMRDLVRLVARAAARRNFKAPLKPAESGTGAEDAREKANQGGNTARGGSDVESE